MSNNGNGNKPDSPFDPALYQSPYPYFGGKGTITHLIWQRLGDVPNYIEPFFGSGVALFKRPHWPWTGNRIETVNDLDGMISNFWRAIHADPATVAHWADWPNNENDLHARHHWLRGERSELTYRLEGDPDYYDAKIAGWWVWGICNWIGSGWCDPQTTGPWTVVDGRLINTGGDGQNRQLLHLGNAGRGINRQLLHLGNAGQGLNRQLLHLGDAGQGINRQLLHLGDAGRGINRKRISLGSSGRGLGKQNDIYTYFAAISDRLRNIRVCCGDWSRICGPSPTYKLGLTGVILDPPYATENRDVGLYANDKNSYLLSAKVRQWAIENGDNPLMRIVLCGYDGEHSMPDNWTMVEWKAGGGYANQGDGSNDNCSQERLWFSPHCLKLETVRQLELI